MNDVEAHDNEGSPIAVSLRETEMASRHFQQLAETNDYYLNRQQSDAQEVLHYKRTLIQIEKRLSKIEQKHINTLAELEAAQAQIGMLRGTVLSKSRNIAQLERKLSNAQNVVQDLRDHLGREQENGAILGQVIEAERLKLEQAILDEREECAKNLGEMKSQMLSNMTASEQWLRQSIYLLKLAIEHLTIRKTTTIDFHFERSVYVKSYCDYCQTWCTTLSRIIDGVSMVVTSDRSHSLADLLDRNDRDFVRSAFLTLLHREPDNDGETFYLFKLREGASKLMILGQMRNSEEGRAVDPGIAGLDRAIKRRRLAQLPLVGGLLRMMWAIEGDSAKDRRLRAYANAIGVMQGQSAEIFREPISAHLRS